MKAETFFKKHIVVLDLVTIIVGLLFLLLGSVVFSGSGMINTILLNVVGRIFPSILFFLLIRKLHLGFANMGEKKNLIQGCIFGVIVVGLFVSLQILFCRDMMIIDQTVTLVQILVVIFMDFCVGLFEESMLRGVVFQSMQMRWQQTRYGVLMAAVVSSLMFGCLHLVNLIQSPHLINTTVSQVCYATFMGIFLCGVYYKTRCIWVPVIIHALIDLTSDLLSVLCSKYASQLNVDIAMSEAVLQTVLILPMAFLGIWCILSAVKEERVGDSQPQMQ